MRIAILGCGSIGLRHLRNLLTLGYSHIVAYDPSQPARRQANARFGIECYASLNEVWDRAPEVAIIAAPTNLHTSLALAAARHGCHLFIEKPLSHSTDGVDLLLQEAKDRGLITMVACNMRFHHGPSTLKRMIDRGTVGEVIAARIQTGSYLPDWRPDIDYRTSYSASAKRGGGAVLDCIHEIDMAIWFFGSGEVVGSAILSAETLGLTVDGLAEILMQHHRGVLSNIHLNFVQRDYCRRYQIIGAEGTLEWDFQQKSICHFIPGSESKIIMQPSGWQLNDMYLEEMAYFLNCVRTKAQSFNDIEHARSTLHVALGAKNIARLRVTAREGGL